MSPSSSFVYYTSVQVYCVWLTWSHLWWSIWRCPDRLAGREHCAGTARASPCHPRDHWGKNRFCVLYKCTSVLSPDDDAGRVSRELVTLTTLYWPLPPKKQTWGRHFNAQGIPSSQGYLRRISELFLKTMTHRDHAPGASPLTDDIWPRVSIIPWSRSHTWARQVMALAWTEVRYGGWNSGQDLLTANIDTNSDQGGVRNGNNKYYPQVILVHQGFFSIYPDLGKQFPLHWG